MKTIARLAGSGAFAAATRWLAVVGIMWFVLKALAR